MSHAERLPNLGSAKALLLPNPVSEIVIDEEADAPLQVLYTASFEELASNCVGYDTIIWLSISLVLVLAWGIGLIMLLYLPFKRYVLRRDIASRKLYVTPNEIIYKRSRPSYIPFYGKTKIEKHVPLSMVINIILEQGCLQSVYGLHTFRVESITHGKSAPVDQLQVQGVHNPALLRKVIVTHASQAIQDLGRSRTLKLHVAGGESMFSIDSLTLGPAVLRSPSRAWKTMNSPHHTPLGPRSVVPSDLMLHKLDEVSKSMRKIEFLIENTQGQPSSVSNREI